MKYLLTIAAVVCAFMSNAAMFVDLKNGINDVNAAGEIVAIECNTVGASQAVTAAVETAVTEFTNAYKTVVAPHLRYSFTITNFDGQASVATNVLDRFNYADWQTTNGVSKILGDVSTARVIVTNTVADGVRAKATYTHSEAVGTGNASSHYLKITPGSTKYFIGGRVRVQCGDGDSVRMLIK